MWSKLLSGGVFRALAASAWLGGRLGLPLYPTSAARDRAAPPAVREADALVAETHLAIWGDAHRDTTIGAPVAVGPFADGGDGATPRTGGWFAAAGRLAELPGQPGDAMGDATGDAQILRAFAEDAHADLRAILTGGGWRASEYVLSWGQQSDPASVHFVDQVGDYLAGPGRYHRMAP